MSKRSGEFVTLREVVDEVGRDAVRFMMLYRKNDAVLDFDLAKVIEQSRDNPVFYVQYGHARGQSIFRNAREVVPDASGGRPDARRTCWRRRRFARLEDTAELALMRRMALISAAGRSRRQLPMSRTGSPSISMNWPANFMRSGPRARMCHIYASLSRMIQN